MPYNSNRLYFPLHYIAIGGYCTASGYPVHGVQSLTMNTNFNLEQAFELGQLEIYENIEGLPSVDITAEKVLDGYPLMYHLSSIQSTSASLANRTSQRCDVFVSYFTDANDNASGAPNMQVYCSGMYVNSLTYRFPVEGFCTENINLVGNDKIRIASGTTWHGRSGFVFNGHFDGNDSPASGIQRRQHVKMGSAANGGSVWPRNIPGMTTVNGSGYNMETGSSYDVHLSDVEVSVSLNRSDLLELGRRKPYYRYAQFPTAVSCTINRANGGASVDDGIEAYADRESNLSNEPIMIKISDGTVFDLGNKNKLLSCAQQGGDTGGGVGTISYQYQNFNKFDVSSLNDPNPVL